jgi:Tfp pilus assembly protein PilZ
MSEERRKHPRVAVSLDGRWQGASGASLCKIASLSLGGCFVQTPAPPAVEDKTFVTLFLRGRGSMLLAGRVARVEPGRGFGMQFREMLPETKFQLGEELEHLRRGPQ